MEDPCVCSLRSPCLLSALLVHPVASAQRVRNSRISAGLAAKFLEVCSSVDGEHKGDLGRSNNDATCLGWVEGFRQGFTVYDELLGVPEKDRMICSPRAVTTVQIVRVIKKYVADNPDKAHRATRYVASLALARAFPCKAK